MKYSAAILALASVASAQSLADLPACAAKCLDDAITKDTPCDTTDLACICKSFAIVQGDATGCVISACGADVAINVVLPLAETLCPTGGAAAPSASAPPTSSAAAPPTSSAAAPPTSSAAAPPTSSAAPPTSSAAPPTSSAAPPTSAAAPPTSSAAPPTSAAAPPTSAAAGGSTTLKSVPSGTGSVNGTIPTGGPHVNGAAGLASVGGLAMLALGALAL